MMRHGGRIMPGSWRWPHAADAARAAGGGPGRGRFVDPGAGMTAEAARILRTLSRWGLDGPLGEAARPNDERA